MFVHTEYFLYLCTNKRGMIDRLRQGHFREAGREQFKEITFRSCARHELSAYNYENYKRIENQ